MPTGFGGEVLPGRPSRPTPEPTDRMIADVGDLQEVLDRLSRKAVQGTIARSGGVLVLGFDALSHERSR
jgi:hypothetical protein